MTSLVEDPNDTQVSTDSPGSSGPGIIGGQITSTPISGGTDLSEYNPTSGLQQQSYTPATSAVNRDTETVQGQVNSILSNDSPLMQRARTLALQQANSRGLVNSSMAAEAGTAAMIDKATPIASQDAATYNQRTLANQDATNSAAQFNAGQNNTLLGQGMTIAAQMKAQKDQQGFTAEQSALDRAQQTNLQTQQNQFTAGENALSRTQQTDLQNAQNTFTAAQNALARAQEVALADKSQAAQAALQKAQQDFQAAQSVIDRQQAITLQQSQQDFQALQSKLAAENQVELTKLQASLSEASTSKAFAANAAQNTLAQINAILANGELTPDAKKAAVSNVIAAANSTLQWASSFYNTAVPGMTDPGAPAAAPASSLVAPADATIGQTWNAPHGFTY